MNLQMEINSLKQRIAELEQQAKQEQKFPQDGDKYWSVSMNGRVLGSEWDGYTSEEGRLEIGNVFKTKEQAEFAVEKLKVEAELRKFSRPFECGAFNCCISLDTDDVYLYLDSSRYFHSQGTIYFESTEKAKQAIESVGEERIKKYIFGVED